jgi:hypothetical protein
LRLGVVKMLHSLPPRQLLISCMKSKKKIVQRL